MDSNFLINLTPQQMSEVYAELGTTEEKINNDVGFILEWCQKQPHLPDLQTEQIKVRSFLVACKNSLEKTKEMLDNHYTIKTLLPKCAHFDTTSQLFNDTCEMNICIPLPKISNDGIRVVLQHLKTKDATSYNFMNTTKLMLMALDIRYSKLDFAKKEIVIMDMKFCTMNHVVSILEHLNDFTRYLKGYAYRIHEFHLLNVPSFAISMINLVKSKLKKKIEGRATPCFGSTQNQVPRGPYAPTAR
ncbi:uncharacterized protein LOC126905141 isoform X2 [Daktulosphaira vitifoliae]|uniref:uncharacterized protein LOC126905141 isoform X2 n=1 Tax=Daktulosphaira vitifoliae TaxID=58002 RepID=UPI0021AA8A3C|nr:uncharacterized protein LOC126905141 isoform X2 [Daktulosphaira vitifoliae]